MFGFKAKTLKENVQTNAPAQPPNTASQLLQPVDKENTAVIAPPHKATPAPTQQKLTNKPQNLISPSLERQLRAGINPNAGTAWNAYDRGTLGKIVQKNQKMGPKNKADWYTIKSEEYDKMNKLMKQQKVTSNGLNRDVTTQQTKDYRNFLIATKANLENEQPAKTQLEEMTGMSRTTTILLIAGGIVLVIGLGIYLIKKN